jgi:hypothetical protein
MLGTFVIGLLIISSLILLVGWVSDAIHDAVKRTHAAKYSENPKVGQGRVRSSTPITTLNRGWPVVQSHEPAIIDLAIMSLHEAIPRVAARILQAPGILEVKRFRRVERLMQIAGALGGEGSRMPLVQFHGVPAIAGLAIQPETRSVNVSDLLAARASNHLGAALEGDPRALCSFEQEAERLLETEDIRLPE